MPRRWFERVASIVLGFFSFKKRETSAEDSSSKTSIPTLATLKNRSIQKDLDRREIVECLLSSEFEDFVSLAAAHYNQQLDYLSQDNAYRCQLWNEALSLADDYLSRNRSRLFEWWCLYGSGKGKVLSEEDLVKIDLGISCDEVLKSRLLKNFGIEIKPDEDHFNGGVPAILENDAVNWSFMERVLARKSLILARKSLIRKLRF